MTDEHSTVDQLIAILENRLASVAERDDAAMDLGEYDSPAAMRCLLRIASDPDESEMVQASAGESLAMVWLRNGVFDPDTMRGLTATASSVSGLRRVT